MDAFERAVIEINEAQDNYTGSQDEKLNCPEVESNNSKVAPEVQEIEKPRVFPKIVTKSCRDNLLNKYPALFAKKSLTRMFEYLCLGTFVDRDSKRLIISRGILAGLEGKQEELDNGRYVAAGFLKDVKAALPAFSWQEASEGTPRMVTNRGIDAQDLQWLSENYEQKRIPGTEKVFFCSGENYTVKKMYAVRKETEAFYKSKTAAMRLHKDQEKIINYLEALDIKLFTRLINKNMAATIALKDTMKFDPSKPESKATQERILDVIQEYPKPHYQASADAKTMRIHHANECLIGLKRDLRKSITKGCWEADLRSSQFTILATRLNATKALEFIAQGTSLWKEIATYCKGSAEYTGEEKDAMKTTLYAMAFGKSVEGSYGGDGKWHPGLRHILRPVNLEKMLEHPIIKEMLELRKAWFAQIDRDGGCFDAYGVFQRVIKGKRFTRSVAASVIQSIEFKIIHHVFDVAISQGDKLDFKIVTFQHDGFTFIMNDTRMQKRIFAALQEAVNQAAQRLGVNTCLEFAELT